MVTRAADVNETPISEDAFVEQGTETPVEEIAPGEVVAEATPSPEAVAPEPVPAIPAPVTPAPRVVSLETQQYIARLEQQNQQAQRLTDAKTLEDFTAQHARQLAQQGAQVLGVTPEEILPFVQEIAKQQGELVYQQYQAERTRRGQLNAAFDIGKEFGVDPRTIMDLPSPEAMRQAASQATASGKRDAEIAALKAEVERLKKSSVPAQSYANPTGNADGERPTKDNIDGLYLKNPERYGATYRRFLQTGQLM